MKFVARRQWLLAAGLLGLTASTAAAQVTFTDNFNSGASALWGNQRGAWSAAGGVYDAHQPSNSPTTFSLLPYDRTHSEREREHSPLSLLSLRSAWIPPVLAVVVCGLQLSFWESASAFLASP